MTAYNLYASILSNPKIAAQPINFIGAVAMIIVALLLFIASLLIAYDACARLGAAEAGRARQGEGTGVGAGGALRQSLCPRPLRVGDRRGRGGA